MPALPWVESYFLTRRQFDGGYGLDTSDAILQGDFTQLYALGSSSACADKPVGGGATVVDAVEIGRTVGCVGLQWSGIGVVDDQLSHPKVVRVAGHEGAAQREGGAKLSDGVQYSAAGERFVHGVVFCIGVWMVLLWMHLEG